MSVLLAELAGAAGLYLAGMRRVRAWPAWRAACFAAGLVAIGGALLGVDGERSVAEHMAQHLVLGFVAAPLLVLGSPVALALRATGARRLLRAAWLARPGIGWAAFAATMALTHVPSIYDAAERHALIHAGMHVAWLGAAVLFWRVVLGADPVPHRPGPIGRVLYLLLFSAPMGATGTWLLWSGPADQRDAGAVMLVGGGTALAMITVGVAWAAIVREHRRQLAYEEAVAR